MYCTLEESLEPASHSQLFNLLEKLALLVLMVSQWDIQWSVTNNWSWKRPHYYYYIVVSCSVQEALMPSVKLPAVTVVWVELIRKTLIELLHMQQTLLSILISLHNKLKKEELVVGTSCVKTKEAPPNTPQTAFPEEHFLRGTTSLSRNMWFSCRINRLFSCFMGFFSLKILNLITIQKLKKIATFK